MRYLISIILIISLFASCNKRDKANIEILSANDKFEDFVNYKLDFKLFYDSTFVFNYHESEWEHVKNEMFRGRYFIKSDTINFFPSKFKFTYSDKAIIRDGFIEFLNGERPLKIKIKATTLNSQLSRDTMKYNDYAFFSYDSNFYNCFSGIVKPIDIDNSDLRIVDSLLNVCIGQNIKKTSLKSKNYNKQCITVLDSKGDKIIWINLLCKGDRFTNDFKYNILKVNDGGDCFASLKINITKRLYYDFYVNGHA